MNTIVLTIFTFAFYQELSMAKAFDNYLQKQKNRLRKLKV